MSPTSEEKAQAQNDQKSQEVKRPDKKLQAARGQAKRYRPRGSNAELTTSQQRYIRRSIQDRGLYKRQDFIEDAFVERRKHSDGFGYIKGEG